MKGRSIVLPLERCVFYVDAQFCCYFSSPGVIIHSNKLLPKKVAKTVSYATTNKGFVFLPVY